MTEFSVIFY